MTKIKRLPIKRTKRLPHRRSKYEKIRFAISVAFFTFLMITPMSAFASLGGYEMYDLYVSITNEVKETNELFDKAIEFAATDPFSIIKKASDYSDVANTIRNASSSMALVVATLFLCIDFFKKSVNFEWSRSWENVMLFCVKCIVVKVMVTNFDTIITSVYQGFNTINITKSGFEILSTGTPQSIIVHEKGDGLLGWASYVISNKGEDHTYTFSVDAVKFIHPDAFIPDDGHYYQSVEDWENALVNAASYKFFPMIINLTDQIYFWIMKGIACLTFVQVVGRAFELTVYTILAPLPIATFASEGNCDVGKNFLKKYIACIIQLAVITAMFTAYTGLKTFNFSGLANFAALIALGLGVMKSGAWARNICGTS